MHEMYLAESILQTVTDALSAQPDQRIRSITLEIGQLAAIETGALAFCFETVARGSVAEGARLLIETIPGSGWCAVCRRNAPLAAHYDPCPDCGSYALQPTQGTQMCIKEISISADG